jgi:hypothetical protein
MYLRGHPRLGQGSSIFVSLALAEPPAPIRGRELMRLWFWVVTLTELLGFAVPATVGVLTVHSATAVSLPALLVAGAVEGAMLGFGQAGVLRLALPGLPVRRWIGSTAGAAAFSYLLGLSPSLLADSAVRLPAAIVAAGSIGIGLLLLASIGTVQWIILRRQLERASSWIVTTAAAWLAGLGVFLGVAMPLWHPGQPFGLRLAIGVTGGLLMAATTSAITGWALRRLVR